MPNRLNLPDDLSSLIEKREEEERRQNDADHAQHAAETGAQEEGNFVERRSGKDRREEA